MKKKASSLPLVVYGYKQNVQTVPVNSRKWTSVETIKRNVVTEDVVTTSEPKIKTIVLPDMDATVDGKRVKLLFGNVDSDGFDVNIIPLESAIVDNNNKVVPIVYAARFDLKNKRIIVNGKHLCDLEPIVMGSNTIQPQQPLVFTTWGKQVINGLVVPAAYGGMRFILGSLVQSLVIAATYFPVAVASYGIGYGIQIVATLPHIQYKIAQMAGHYAPEIISLLKPMVYVVTKVGSVAKGVVLG